MSAAGFIISSVFGGLFVHLVSNRYLTFFGVGPDILFLYVMCAGFLHGPVVGGWTGFLLGLVADTLGVSLFGLHSFLFSLTGYIAGKSRRRVDSERVASQVVIALVGTVLLNLAGVLVRYLLDDAGRRSGFWTVSAHALLNAIIMPAVCWGAVWWSHVWGLRCD